MLKVGINNMNMFKISLDIDLVQAYSVFEHVQNTFRRSKHMYNTDTTIVVSYLVYLLISITLTVWVARTLHKRGAIFLVDAFQGNTELAASVNHLLVVGFYLINIGFVTLALKSNATVTSSRAAIEMLSDKLGFVLITLGACISSTCLCSHAFAHMDNTMARAVLRLRRMQC